ncbi:MAG: esterase family protein [Bacteroidaceae bacterium]|nr:esterase family protein [Bacteroidaceae bacterium]
MKKAFSALCICLWACFSIQAAQVDTLMVRSNSMDKDIKVVAIRPDKAVKGEKCPVIYLLHGHSNNARTWMETRPDLHKIADQEGIIFICPDGGYNSWYWDSPLVKNYRYETFISDELISYVDKHFATLPDRSKRAITGFSMGGHGAMWLAIRHQDVFGAVGSSSGGLDIRPFPNNWGMKTHLGERDENFEVWNNHTVINQLDRLKDGALAIIIDCGVDDFFFGVNKAVHERLLEQKVGHDFIARPGGHGHKFWNNSIVYQIKFFKKFFEKE